MPNILVIAEHDRGALKQATLSAVGFARKVVAEAGGAFEILVLGHNINSVADSLLHCGAALVLSAQHPLLEFPLADKCAQVIAKAVRQRNSTLVVAASST